METLSVGQKLVHESHTETTVSPWKPLYRVGGAAALTIVGIMVIQIIVYIAWPPPSTVLSYFTLFHKNFGKVTAYAGIMTGVLMLIPSTAGINKTTRCAQKKEVYHEQTAHQA